MPFVLALLAALFLAPPAFAKKDQVRPSTKPLVTRTGLPITISRRRGGGPSVSMGQSKVVYCKAVACGKGNEGKACFDCDGTIVATSK